MRWRAQRTCWREPDWRRTGAALAPHWREVHRRLPSTARAPTIRQRHVTPRAGDLLRAQRAVRRNVVERCLTRLKQWRGLATRYEKRALNDRVMLVLVSVVLWLEA
jgi:transposase